MAVVSVMFSLGSSSSYNITNDASVKMEAFNNHKVIPYRTISSLSNFIVQYIIVQYVVDSPHWQKLGSTVSLFTSLKLVTRLMNLVKREFFF